MAKKPENRFWILRFAQDDEATATFPLTPALSRKGRGGAASGLHHNKEKRIVLLAFKVS
jgi:hypothetical protein